MRRMSQTICGKYSKLQTSSNLVAAFREPELAKDTAQLHNANTQQ